MADIQQQLCDGCGALLNGKHGIAWVKLPCLEINGQIVYEEMSTEKPNWRQHLFVTRTPNEKLAFCWGKDPEKPDLKCLMDYITFRVQKQREWNEKKLKGEANEEWHERQTNGYVKKKPFMAQDVNDYPDPGFK